MEEEKQKKKKGQKLTAQCLGIILVIFALGMFVGYSCNYQDTIANFFTGQHADRTHLIHSSSEMAEHGSRVGYYILGSTENENYEIEFNEPEQDVNKFYTIEGTFVNTSGSHFTTVELSFSLLDKDGNKISDAHAYCDGLNSNQTWKFVATNSSSQPYMLKDTVASAILDDVLYTIA